MTSETSNPMAGAMKSQGGTNRRQFLFKAAVGLAAVAGLGTVLGRRLRRSAGTVAPLQLEEGSIFMPREDQRDRVLGGR